MILWKIWFDVRTRFYISLALILFFTIFLILLYPLLHLVISSAKPDLDAVAAAQLRHLMKNYRLFMDEGWFRELQPIWIFAIVLSLGGVLSEKKIGAIFVTLSLPVARTKWILTQWLATSALVLALLVTGGLLIVAGGIAYGSFYPPLSAIWGTLVLMFAALPWISLTLALSSLLQDRLKTTLILIFGVLILDILKVFTSVRVWLPISTLDALEGGPFPWRSVLVILAVTIGGLLVAIRTFQERDY
jgi:ABC-type transport system involved in multi-copper enzyme maturation permease subunit